MTSCIWHMDLWVLENDGGQSMFDRSGTKPSENSQLFGTLVQKLLTIDKNGVFEGDSLWKNKKIIPKLSSNTPTFP